MPCVWKNYCGLPKLLIKTAEYHINNNVYSCSWKVTHVVDGHTISVDETIGIQVLEHKYPDKLVMLKKVVHMGFKYIFCKITN